MGFFLDIDRWGRNKTIAAIIIVYLFTRLVFLTAVPFIADEGPYSVMIEEQIAHPAFAVTFLDQTIGWKPPLMFWIYGIFVSVLRGLPIPIDALYRLPGIFFGLVNVILIFFIFERVLKDRKLAFLGCIAYLSIFVSVQTDVRVLTDTLSGTFIFAGILAYMIGLEDKRMFLAGGLLTALAYLTKQTVAATVPVLALALLFEKDRKKLLDPLFLVSLIGFPLGMFLFNASLSSSFGGDTAYLLQNYVLAKLTLDNISQSLVIFLPMGLTLIPLALFGFVKELKENLMMSAWFALTIFPIIAGNMMPFYFYPVMPAVAYFALRLLSKNEKGEITTDRFFYIIFAIIIILGFIFGALQHLSYYPAYENEKDAGEYLAGKENVLIIGDYSPGIFGYKMLEEKRSSGKWLDYGMIILQSSNLSGALYKDFIANYSAYPSGIHVSDGNFQLLFVPSDLVFRKNTSITRFDYICIAGNSSVTPGGVRVLNNSYVQIYDMRK